MSQNPTPNQQNMIQMIQPAQATQLLEALKKELAQAKAAGQDTARARQHYARAEQIKQVLLNYRQQQQQRAAAARAGTGSTAGSAPQATAAQGSAQPAQAQPAASNMVTRAAAATAAPGGAPASNLGTAQLGQGVSAPASGAAQPTATGAAGARPSYSAGLGPASAAATGVTTEKYNQVRTRLQDLERKIRTLEAGKRPDMLQEETTLVDNQLRELRLKYGQYLKFAVYMKNQLLEQVRSASPRPGTPQSSTPNALAAGSATGMAPANTANVAKPSTAGPAPGTASTPGATTQPGLAAPAATAMAQDASKSGSRAASPGIKDPLMSGVNLSLITKASVPSIPILSTINVKPQTPVTLKPGTNNFRPTLTSGASSGLGQIVNSPAITRMPTFDMASTGPIQDNSGRVLTKRKLTELVNSIGADEGDGKTTIDGDVEELLLDLADEFVSSVTTFACRLAKHRKTDTVDVRDVQLHLERNWNIRIPGHATDEIRSMRKWQPSSLYTQKVSGVDIVKAVNGNIN